MHHHLYRPNLHNKKVTTIAWRTILSLFHSSWKRIIHHEREFTFKCNFFSCGSVEKVVIHGSQEHPGREYTSKQSVVKMLLADIADHAIQFPFTPVSVNWRQCNSASLVFQFLSMVLPRGPLLCFMVLPIQASSCPLQLPCSTASTSCHPRLSGLSHTMGYGSDTFCLCYPGPPALLAALSLYKNAVSDIYIVCLLQKPQNYHKVIKAWRQHICHSLSLFVA